MAEVFFENPPILNGTAEDQLKQLYNHLFKVSNQLNEALMTISVDQLAPDVKKVISNGAKAEETTQKNTEALKSLIIKSAEVVRSEMEEIRTTLESHYTAISEQFGTYQEDIEARFRATATGISQNYDMIQTVQAAEDENATMLRKLNGSIFSGILDTNTGEIGIAIGYNVTNNDGSLNQANKMATFTADRLTFYINEIPVAWFGNRVFHITDGEVTGSMRMGNFIWKILSNGSMGLMKG